MAKILLGRKYIYYELTLPHRHDHNSNAPRHPICFIANPKLVPAAGAHNLIKRMGRAIPVMPVHVQSSKLLCKVKGLVEISVLVS